MKFYPSLHFLANAAALAVVISSCSFLEDIPVPQITQNLACYSSISICRAGTTSSLQPAVKSLDIFIYNDDGTYLLDSYQQLVYENETFDGHLEAGSTSGKKIAVIIANMHDRSFSYTDILSLDALASIQASFYDEDAEHPTMSGTCSFTAGPGIVHKLELVPVTCRVRIRSFKVDFSSRPYHDKELTDIRCYLINVNASCSFACPDSSRRTDVVNCGRYDDAGTHSMKCPSLILNIGHPESSCFYCYPYMEESGAASGTLLVIEGKIGGNTYYYPVRIGNGCIVSGTDYVYDILITRSGSIDPEDVLEEGTLRIKAEVKPWKDHDWEEIEY